MQAACQGTQGCIHLDYAILEGYTILVVLMAKQMKPGPSVSDICLGMLEVLIGALPPRFWRGFEGFRKSCYGCRLSVAIEFTLLPGFFLRHLT